jgi:hypothetical protein
MAIHRGWRLPAPKGLEHHADEKKASDDDTL